MRVKCVVEPAFVGCHHVEAHLRGQDALALTVHDCLLAPDAVFACHVVEAALTLRRDARIEFEGLKTDVGRQFTLQSLQRSIQVSQPNDAPRA